jgi:hypothetical protein
MQKQKQQLGLMPDVPKERAAARGVVEDSTCTSLRSLLTCLGLELRELLPV